MNYSSRREQPEPESAPKPECDAESGCSSRTARRDRSHQGSDCSSSGYSSASFGSNRSKNNDCDFNSHSPFNPETFGKIHEALLKSQQEVMRQHEDVSRQREDLSRQREDLSRQREDLLRQREDFLRQREDFLRQQAVQQEAQQKIINVGDEQHLRTGTTHSSGSKRMDEMNEELERTRLSLKQKDEELQSLEQELNNMMKRHASMKEMEEFYKNKLKNYDEALKQKEEELKSFKKRMNEELERARIAVYEKEEELWSFKDRVAGDVASSIKTGKAINLNPVSKPRIIELYEDLRWNWPKIKASLKSKGGNGNSSKIRDLMEKAFNNAQAEMEKKVKQIDAVFELNMAKSDTANSKVKEYRQLTIQNLQLAIYSEKQDLKNPTPLHQCQTLQHVVDYLRYECFWLGRLMALNDPPLEPDWCSPPTTYDKWDLLPHSITECQKDQANISKVRKR
ncbi:uncharacterized protein PFB0145c-like isoform X1 [Poecilia formosa]|uniref:uncharacterized protein PFB0145c-like isoform X1 n=1 Tax=Poecilia formosa TaxID=48698 RepID=UPI0007BA946E|nr:PREDICTED: uncharacterized protein PFB0145c-like isoform X1 [Poecilia formosa]